MGAPRPRDMALFLLDPGGAETNLQRRPLASAGGLFSWAKGALKLPALIYVKVGPVCCAHPVARIIGGN